MSASLEGGGMEMAPCFYGVEVTPFPSFYTARMLPVRVATPHTEPAVGVRGGGRKQQQCSPCDAREEAVEAAPDRHDGVEQVERRAVAHGAAVGKPPVDV